MKKKVNLRDGSKVLIRKIKKTDLDKSLVFFRSLPKKDREYLRADVTKREIAKKRIASIDPRNSVRIVAIVDGDIVADGSLEIEGQDWKKHIAELRIIVSRPFRDEGIGSLMARELFSVAASKKVEEIIVRIIKPQVGIKRIFKKLGFRQDAVVRKYVKDIDGEKHDLILMRCNLELLWQKLDDFITGFDWQRTR